MQPKHIFTGLLCTVHLCQIVEAGSQQLDLSGFSHTKRARMDFCWFRCSGSHFVSSSGCSSLQIRGMNIDEAIAQLEFNDKKGAKIMREV